MIEYFIVDLGKPVARINSGLTLRRVAKSDDSRTAEGISATEIIELAAAQGQILLPLSYQHFMSKRGRGAGLFQKDAIFFYPEVKSLKLRLAEMLADEGIEFSLPAKAFVFGAYQGFQFHYFICDGDPDPKVFGIDDGGGEPELLSEKFSTYIEKSISDYSCLNDENF